jgi:hypothetical protein
MIWLAMENAARPRPIRKMVQLLVSAQIRQPAKNSTPHSRNSFFLPQISLALPSRGVADAPTRPRMMTAQ